MAQTKTSRLTASTNTSHNTLTIEFLNADLPLDVHRSPTPQQVRVHDHANFIEIVLVTKGSAIHHWGKTTQMLSAGDLFCIAPEEPHGYTEVNNFEIINCLFDPELIKPHQDLITSSSALVDFLIIEPLYREETRQRRLIKLPSGAFEQAIDLLDAIDQNLRANTSKSLIILGQLYQFLGLIETHHTGTPTEVIAAQNWAFAQAQSHMRTNLAEDLDLKSLAETACLSPAHFSRVFKKATGLSPIAYLTKLRLERATQLLTTTRKSITEIGSDCGFQDPAYFARVFKKTYQQSPRAYRQTAKSSK